jgi:hypothetical protein
VVLLQSTSPSPSPPFHCATGPARSRRRPLWELIASRMQPRSPISTAPSIPHSLGETPLHSSGPTRSLIHIRACAATRHHLVLWCAAASVTSVVTTPMRVARCSRAGHAAAPLCLGSWAGIGPLTAKCFLFFPNFVNHLNNFRNSSKLPKFI